MKQPGQQAIPFNCPKCNCNTCEEDTIRTAGGSMSKLFNIQNKKFATKSCTACGYTELYKKQTSTGGNIIDFFFN